MHNYSTLFRRFSELLEFIVQWNIHLHRNKASKVNSTKRNTLLGIAEYGLTYLLLVGKKHIWKARYLLPTL